MKNDFIRLQKELNKYNQLAVVCHKKPDGDAVGSALSLVNYLADMGKQAQAYCIDEVPASLRFLPGVENIRHEIDDFFRSVRAVVAADCSDWKMMAFAPENFIAKTLIVIDHHISNPLFGHINLVNPQAAATTEIIANYFDSIAFKIDKITATYLLTGLYTDTDAFSNLATTPESLRASGELLRRGGNLKEITANTIQNKSITSLKLWGRALQRLRLDKKKGIAVTVIKHNDFVECQASEEDAEGVANLLNHLADVKMAMVLREQKDGTVKGSLRTTDELIDVSKIAKLLGGGGHAKAAGFTVSGKVVESEKGWEIV